MLLGALADGLDGGVGAAGGRGDVVAGAVAAGGVAGAVRGLLHRL